MPYFCVLFSPAFSHFMQRLATWFVQNYDLVGCNHFTCSNLSVMPEHDVKKIIEKVVPMPIGLDFHTLSEKIKNTKVDQLICDQRKELKRIQITANTTPFKEKRVMVNAAFSCQFNEESDEIRIKTRGKLCSCVNRAKLEGNQQLFSVAEPKEKVVSRNFLFGNDKFSRGNEKYRNSPLRQKRIQFWEQLAICSFSFAPPGFGMDTHRFWEILQMHSVPIVITSPLDKLYEQYPVVILKEWSDAFKKGALEKYKIDIMKRYGVNPFHNVTMHKLTAKYWTDLVHREANKKDELLQNNHIQV